MKKRLYSEKGKAPSPGGAISSFLGTPKSMTTSEDFSSDILNTLNKLKESTSRYENKSLSCAFSDLHLSGYSDQLTDAEVPVFSPVDEEHDHTQERLHKGVINTFTFLSF